MASATDETTKGAYSIQCFRDVAVRRVQEAQVLLDGAKSSCDGAVTCALLATECALKATLLYGHEASYDRELSKKLYDRFFHGAQGHALLSLYREQAPRVHRREKAPLDEVSRLDLRDRYEHRYGKRRPKAKDAKPVVTDARVVVEWMKRILW